MNIAAVQKDLRDLDEKWLRDLERAGKIDNAKNVIGGMTIDELSSMLEQMRGRPVDRDWTYDEAKAHFALTELDRCMRDAAELMVDLGQEACS